MTYTSLIKGALAAAVASGVLFTASAAAAGGGKAIGGVAGDLTERFTKAVTPEMPKEVPAPKLDYTPPERAPGESTTWSTGKTEDAAPREALPKTFNRNAADRPASTGLTDVFNQIRRGLN